MIKKDGYELFGVTKIVKSIKQHNYFTFDVVKISRFDNLIWADFIPKDKVKKREFILSPKYLLDPSNCMNYANYVRTGRKVVTYKDMRDALIDIMINCDDEELKKEVFPK